MSIIRITHYVSDYRHLRYSFRVISGQVPLAEQHADQFTRDSACVLRDFYDIFTGADTVDELKLRDETIQLLKLGAFELSKWASNCSELLEIDNRDRVPVVIRDNAADSCILGMQWNECQNTF